jgi:hypothetical protein
VRCAREQFQVTADGHDLRHDIPHAAIVPDGSKLPRVRAANTPPSTLSS